MPITTLKLSEQLKARVADLVAGTGQSAHAFMLDAIEKQAEFTEKRRRLVAQALAAEKTMIRSGKGYRAQDVHEYMSARAAGKKPLRPKATAWR